MLKNKSNIIWIIILGLIVIEQTIKIIINNNYLYHSVQIIRNFLYFQPMFNRDYSWINSMLQLGIGKWLHIILVLFMVVIMFLFYRYIVVKIGTNKLINTMFVFIFSGASCSLIDKVFWDGSLDYIYLYGYFTFDLKDVYINVFIGFLILSMFVKNDLIDKINLKDFINYLLKRT